MKLDVFIYETFTIRAYACLLDEVRIVIYLVPGPTIGKTVAEMEVDWYWRLDCHGYILVTHPLAMKLKFMCGCDGIPVRVCIFPIYRPCTHIVSVMSVTGSVTLNLTLKVAMPSGAFSL